MITFVIRSVFHRRRAAIQTIAFFPFFMNKASHTFFLFPSTRTYILSAHRGSHPRLLADASQNVAQGNWDEEGVFVFVRERQCMVGEIFFYQAFSQNSSQSGTTPSNSEALFLLPSLRVVAPIGEPGATTKTCHDDDAMKKVSWHADGP
jgi:hypothetical protein